MQPYRDDRWRLRTVILETSSRRASQLRIQKVPQRIAEHVAAVYDDAQDKARPNGQHGRREQVIHP